MKGRRLLAPLIRWGLQRSSLRAGLCLAYHRIGDPQGDPSRELVPALGSRRFAAQLSHLRRHYRVVPASGLLDAVRGRSAGEPFPVAVTFDDDLPSHAGVAMPILRSQEVPATFFVCGASLDGPFAFWWERLQRAMDRGGDRSSIHRVAATVQVLPPGEREERAAQLAEKAGPDPPDAGLREQDLRALAESGLDVGFHTLWHYDLPVLDDEQLDTALTEGRAAIEGITGTRLDLLAYPHGSADPRIAAAAARAGFRAAFTVGERAVTADTDPLLIARVEPTYGTIRQFGLKLVLVLLRASRDRP
jgi:peptidoglycan/xylan/chitin deacetylase (PgdA/CDA1 family)